MTANLEFQSSTRLAAIPTGRRLVPRPRPRVSILYEVSSYSDVTDLLNDSYYVPFQSSTRLAAIPTEEWLARMRTAKVSILYEVSSYSDSKGAHHRPPQASFQSSTRLAAIPTNVLDSVEGRVTSFNPLRG